MILFDPLNEWKTAGLYEQRSFNSLSPFTIDCNFLDSVNINHKIVFDFILTTLLTQSNWKVGNVCKTCIQPKLKHNGTPIRCKAPTILMNPDESLRYFLITENKVLRLARKILNMKLNAKINIWKIITSQQHINSSFSVHTIKR